MRAHAGICACMVRETACEICAVRKYVVSTQICACDNVRAGVQCECTCFLHADLFSARFLLSIIMPLKAYKRRNQLQRLIQANSVPSPAYVQRATCWLPSPLERL